MEGTRWPLAERVTARFIAGANEAASGEEAVYAAKAPFFFTGPRHT